MFKKILSIMLVSVLASGLAWAQGKYSIKQMTPEVQQALSSRKDRFSELRSFKSSGAIGENNHGYVEVLKNDGQASSLAKAENRDRKVVYQTIAQQNGLEDALSTIEAAFADVQREKAESGDKIQTEDGQWVNK